MPKTKTSFLFILILFLLIIPVINIEATAAKDSKPLTGLKKPLGPTLSLDNGTVAIYVIFRFGAWVRIAYNNSKVVAPVAVYVYSRSEFPVTIKSNYNQTFTGTWGLALNLSKLDLKRPLILHIKYRDKVYTLRFTAVKSIEEKEKKPSGPMFTLAQLKEWLDREAQASAVLALIAIISAFGLKRKLLLLRTFNGLNLLLLFLSGIAIYIIATKTGHSPWLVLPFALSYITTYKVTPAGRKVYLIKIIPSLRKILWETAVLYRTAEGMLAYAKQSISEAFKRLLGKHIVLKDAETGKLGEVASDKFWTVEDVEYYEKSEGLLVLDAQLTKERVIEKEEGGIYE